MNFILAALVAASAVAVNAKTTCTKGHTTKCPPHSTICVDSINSCGQTYGGCYCAGGKTPTYTDPGCPSSWYASNTITSSIVPSSSLAAPVASSSCPLTLCEDRVNWCGMWYGGCYAACSDSPEPTFSVPVCPSSYSGSTWHVSSWEEPTSTSGAPGSITPCPYICEENYDDCGNTFGPGCYTSCDGDKKPTYTIPSCSASATPYN